MRSSSSHQTNEEQKDHKADIVVRWKVIFASVISLASMHAGAAASVAKDQVRLSIELAESPRSTVIKKVNIVSGHSFYPSDLHQDLLETRATIAREFRHTLIPKNQDPLHDEVVSHMDELRLEYDLINEDLKTIDRALEHRLSIKLELLPGEKNVWVFDPEYVARELQPVDFSQLNVFKDPRLNLFRDQLQKHLEASTRRPLEVKHGVLKIETVLIADGREATAYTEIQIPPAEKKAFGFMRPRPRVFGNFEGADSGNGIKTNIYLTRSDREQIESWEKEVLRLDADVAQTSLKACSRIFHDEDGR